jgi:UDP-N-acetylmuramoyl-L-alanyl-D-glutamate--2,6-diaminopimelate ligase
MKITEFLAKYSNFFNRLNLVNKSVVLNDAVLNLNGSKENEIVFYNRSLTEESEKLFFERFKSAQTGLLITNSDRGLPENLNYAVSDRLSEIIVETANLFYPTDFSNLVIVGITGTNGKSTLVHLCRELLRKRNIKSLSIGTMGVLESEDNCLYDFGVTTPGYLDLRKVFYRFKDKFKYYFMEVSSHALDQNRFKDIRFDIGAWTNLTQDHLDYHKTIENYFKAKLLIFDYMKTKTLLISRNADLAVKLKTKNVTTEVASPIELKSSIFSAGHNLENLELALSILQKLGFKYSVQELGSLQTPKGRFNHINHKGKDVIIDYAHSPDAILQIISSTKKVFPGKKVWTLFGCGGNRDKSKRPLMGEIASLHSDYVFVTSDNPRFEEPEQIVDDIRPGLKNKNFAIFIDRRTALKEAVNSMDQNTVLIVAGKGHETYQEIKGVKHHFSDEEEVKRILGI